MTNTAANKKIVTEFIDGLFSRADPDAVDAYLSADFVNHDPPFGVSNDREGMRAAGATFRAAFPDWRSELHLLIAEADLVAEHFTARGTHRSEVMGVAPTGREVSLKGINIFRIRDGRICERWGASTIWASSNSSVFRAWRLSNGAMRRRVVAVGRAAAPGEAVRALAQRCHAGLDSMSLQREVVEFFGRVLSVDAVFCASVDPATLLFTGAVLHEIPPEETPRFLANEFLEDDVNKFRTLANRRFPVDWLDRATGTRREASVRYREIMAPLGLGDELRAAFRSGGECWGFLCLHREGAPLGFTEAEARLVARLSSHVGEGLCRAMLVEAPDAGAEPDASGVLVLGEDRTLVATTAAGDRWLWELSSPEQFGSLPVAVEAVLAGLEAIHSGRHDVVPRVRVRTRSRRWAVLHASDIAGFGEARHVAIVVEPAKPSELAPLVLLAYGLTQREAEVAQSALQGRPNRAVARALRISENTVEDHLKSVFAKVGVGSRGELTARIFGDQYGR